MALGPLAMFYSATADCIETVSIEVHTPWGWEMVESTVDGSVLFQYNPQTYGFTLDITVPNKDVTTWNSFNVETLYASLLSTYLGGDTTLSIEIIDEEGAQNTDSAGYRLTVQINGYRSEEQATGDYGAMTEVTTLVLGSLGTCPVSGGGEPGTLCQPGYINYGGTCTEVNGCVDGVCLTCYGYKLAGATSGFYDIMIDGQTQNVYCDTSTNVAYTFKGVTNGRASYHAYGENSCGDYGMMLWIPRSQQHWQRAFQYGVIMGGDNRDNLHPFAIVRAANGCGTCTGTPMNYDAIRAVSNAVDPWHAWDGGRWWIRSTTYSEPNGDYTANCWLGLLSVESSMASIQFNDLSCNYNTGTRYLCSTNDAEYYAQGVQGEVEA